jgi:cation:H+ antiporter
MALITQCFLFILSLTLVMYGAARAMTHATVLAEALHLSKYTIGFLVVAVISILPETFISLNAAASGIPEFGLGTLLGSNVADLTLVFALTVFIARRSIKVESETLKHHRAYPFILIVPLVLGLDGEFSRIDGLALLLVGAIFYYRAFKHGRSESAVVRVRDMRVLPTSTLLLMSVTILLLGAHGTVTSASMIAEYFSVSPVLIGMLVVGLGTTIPELFFAIRSARSKEEAVGIGDILGTVLADATIVIGVLALIFPFSFPVTIVYVAGAFMVAGAFLLFTLMRSGHMLTRREGFALVILWILFVATEFIVHQGMM